MRAGERTRVALHLKTAPGANPLAWLGLSCPFFRYVLLPSRPPSMPIYRLYWYLRKTRYVDAPFLAASASSESPEPDLAAKRM